MLLIECKCLGMLNLHLPIHRFGTTIPTQLGGGAGVQGRAQKGRYLPRHDWALQGQALSGEAGQDDFTR